MQLVVNCVGFERCNLLMSNSSSKLYFKELQSRPDELSVDTFKLIIPLHMALGVNE